MADSLTLQEMIGLANIGCNGLTINPIRAARANVEVAAMRQVDPRLNASLTDYSDEQYQTFLGNVGLLISDKNLEKLEENMQEQRNVANMLSGGNANVLPGMISYIVSQNIGKWYPNALSIIGQAPKQYTQLPADPQPQNP